MPIGTDFGTGQVLWSFIWFTLFFIWIWLLIVVFSDIFRSHDLGGFAKFLWILFIIVMPYLGGVSLADRVRKDHSCDPSFVAAAAAQAHGLFCLNAAPAIEVPVDVLRRADLVILTRTDQVSPV